MSVQSAWAAFVDFCGKVTTWCLWFGRLVVAIGIAYAAARIFALGQFNLNGVSLPVPRVNAEVTQLIYLAGCIYLVGR